MTCRAASSGMRVGACQWLGRQFDEAREIGRPRREQHAIEPAAKPFLMFAAAAARRILLPRDVQEVELPALAGDRRQKRHQLLHEEQIMRAECRDDFELTTQERGAMDRIEHVAGAERLIDDALAGGVRNVGMHLAAAFPFDAVAVYGVVGARCGAGREPEHRALSTARHVRRIVVRNCTALARPAGMKRSSLSASNTKGVVTRDSASASLA